jgi:hypothetical protein
MLAASSLLIADHHSLQVVIIAVAIIILICARQMLAPADLAGVPRLAHHDGTRDALTGLPDRRQLIADLQTAIETASPTAQRTPVLSISTASRPTTTRSDTPPAISCWAGWPGDCRTRCRSPAAPTGSAAMSSPRSYPPAR